MPFLFPDGKAIAFDQHHRGKSWEIYVMNADGGGKIQLTTTRRESVLLVAGSSRLPL